MDGNIGWITGIFRMRACVHIYHLSLWQSVPWLLLSDAESWISCSGWFMQVKSTVSVSHIFSRNQCSDACSTVVECRESQVGKNSKALSRKWRQKRKKQLGVVGRIDEYLNLSVILFAVLPSARSSSSFFMRSTRVTQTHNVQTSSHSTLLPLHSSLKIVEQWNTSICPLPVHFHCRQNESSPDKEPVIYEQS